MATLVTSLSTSLAALNDGYGSKLYFDPQTSQLLIGDSTNDVVGKLYVYSKSGSIFTFTNYLTANGRAVNDIFGSGFASASGIIFSGCPGKAKVCVYMPPIANPSSETFSLTTSTWTSAAALSGLYSFGSSVALTATPLSSYLLIGAPYLGSNNLKGAVYPFTFNNTTQGYTQFSIITSADTLSGDAFGYNIAVNNNNALVSAPYKLEGSVGGAGAVYYYTLNTATNNWTYQQTLTQPIPTLSAGFGTSVNLLNNTAIIAAPGESNGRAYVYTLSGSVWSRYCTLTGVDFVTSNPTTFATSVALTASNIAVVGASYDVALDYSTSIGGLYVFQLNGQDNWAQLSNIKNPISATATQFGRSLVTLNDSIAVGAPYAGSSFNFGEVVILNNIQSGYNPSAPVITSPTTLNAFNGYVTQYYITATNSPSSFNATGLPGWATVNQSTGLISGTPNATGTTNATIYASNAGGISNMGLQIIVATPPSTYASYITPTNIVGLSIGSAGGTGRSLEALANYRQPGTWTINSNASASNLVTFFERYTQGHHLSSAPYLFSEFQGALVFSILINQFSNCTTNSYHNAADGALSITVTGGSGGTFTLNGMTSNKVITNGGTAVWNNLAGSYTGSTRGTYSLTIIDTNTGQQITVIPECWEAGYGTSNIAYQSNSYTTSQTFWNSN